jgi:uncharacterized protein YkwD
MRLTPINRRSFLQAATSFAGVALTSRLASANDFEKMFADIRLHLLEMVNEERAVEKVQKVALDDFATKIATQHALDMIKGEFASHWGSDGLKPYHRYSFAGGTDSTQENVSAADNTWSNKFADLKQDTSYLHLRLYQEKPPNDGHRKTILAPQHTHLGIGFALDNLRLRMVELFVARYLEIKKVERNIKPGTPVTISGRLLNSNHFLNQVEVCYEPLPTTPELSWLRQPRGYTLPTDAKLLLPKVPPPLKYLDGSSGVIDWVPGGKFSFPVNFFKGQPGIYTVACFVKRDRGDKGFPAAEICFRVE